MEIVVGILMFFILFNMCLKLSFWGNIWQIGMAVLLGVFSILVYPYAIEQSQTQLDGYLKNTEILANMAVLVTIEGVIGLGFCFLSLSKLYQEKSNRWQKILKFYPSLLVFPVLFYGLTQSVFYFTGMDFFTAAIIFALCVIVLILLFSLGLKSIIPEEDLRLELHFFLNLVVVSLGLIGTNNGSVVYVAPKQDGVDLVSLGLMIIGFVVFFILGFIANKLWWKYYKGIGIKKL